MNSLKNELYALYNRISNACPIGLALRSTLLLLIYSRWVTTEDWRFFAPLTFLATIGLLVPEYHKNKFVWYAITACMVIKTFLYWWTQDNHIFVLTYWCIAISIALSLKDSHKLIAINARSLVGLTFFFAALWKGFLSPDFMSGNYFHFTFLTDMRFAEEAWLLAGIDQATIQQNMQQLATVAAVKSSSAQLTSNETLAFMTLIVTWHTIIIESVIFLTFLWPETSRKFSWIYRSRNFVLVFFSWTTYLATPIITFGWVLNTLAIAQTKEHEKLDRFLLVLTIPMLLIYKNTPIMSWIVSIIR